MDSRATIQDISPETMASLEASMFRMATAAIQEVMKAQLLSPAEACKMFQPAITKLTLSKWAKDGLIPEHRIGGRIFYKRGELLESVKTLKKYKATRL